MQLWNELWKAGDKDGARLARDRAQQCYQCAMGAPRYLARDGVMVHPISCNQAIECGAKR